MPPPKSGSPARSKQRLRVQKVRGFALAKPRLFMPGNLPLRGFDAGACAEVWGLPMARLLPLQRALCAAVLFLLD